MTLFERVFGGNDAVYGLTEAAIDNAIAQYGEGQAVSFPDTAYSLPCYYAVTGSKVGTLGELKQALGVVKTPPASAPPRPPSPSTASDRRSRPPRRAAPASAFCCRTARTASPSPSVMASAT